MNKEKKKVKNDAATSSQSPLLSAGSKTREVFSNCLGPVEDLPSSSSSSGK